jgi:hypothetical protein
MALTTTAAGKFISRYYVILALTSLVLRGETVSNSTTLIDLIVVSATSIAIRIVGLLLSRK